MNILSQNRYQIQSPNIPKHLFLNSGYSIPSVGLGTWKSESGKVKEAVKFAIQSGYRHIDCAHVYGNEAEIGEALEEVISDTQNGISREDLFITSKLWNTKHKENDVRSALQNSLRLTKNCFSAF